MLLGKEDGIISGSLLTSNHFKIWIALTVKSTDWSISMGYFSLFLIIKLTVIISRSSFSYKPEELIKTRRVFRYTNPRHVLHFLIALWVPRYILSIRMTHVDTSNCVIRQAHAGIIIKSFFEIIYPQKHSDLASPDVDIL